MKKRCSWILKAGPDKGLRCVLTEGHKANHTSVTESQRYASKRRWEVENIRVEKNECPTCGKLKNRSSKQCLECYRAGRRKELYKPFQKMNRRPDLMRVNVYYDPSIIRKKDVG